MKRRAAVAALAVGALVGWACSSGTSGYCNLPSTLAAKQGSCDAGATTNSSCTDPGKCSAAFNSCPAADQTVLNNFAGCIQNLPVCQPGQEATWSSAALACIFGFAADAGLSQTCINAFNAQFADAGCAP